MSKPRYRWWGYVKAVIRAYPDLKKQYESLHTASITANTSGMPGSGGVSRSTEDISLRSLPAPDQKEMEAVEKAMVVTKRMRTGEERSKLIDLVFFKKTYKLRPAAEQVIHISYDTAVDYHGDFIMLTAYFLDRVTFEQLEERLKFALKFPKSVV